jgi:hypothetical protein
MLRSSLFESKYCDVGEEKPLGDDGACSDTVGSLYPYARFWLWDEDIEWGLSYIEGSLVCGGLVCCELEGRSCAEVSRKCVLVIFLDADVQFRSGGVAAVC